MNRASVGLLLCALITVPVACSHSPSETQTDRAATTLPIVVDDPPASPSTRPTPTTVEIRRGMPMSLGLDRDERQQRGYEFAARRIEPSLHGTRERLAQYLEFFKREFVKDPRLFAFDVSAQTDGEKIVLSGFAEYVEHREALALLLRRLGFEQIENRIELLPTASLGEEKFALVTATRTFVYDRPQSPRETVSECVLGEALFLLKATDDSRYFLCHGADGYVGYVAAADVRRLNADAFHAYQSGRQVRITGDCDLGGGRIIPTGAKLKLKFDDDRMASVESPDGSELSLPIERVLTIPARTSERVERAIASAMAMSGTPYVWGGKTRQGVDCSGLIQSAFRAQGVNLPRDADQQAYVGALVATRWDTSGLRRGDTLYFLSRRGAIHHTALYLGDGKFLEAANKGVKVTSLRKGDADYDEARAKSLCFGRRVLD